MKSNKIEGKSENRESRSNYRMGDSQADQKGGLKKFRQNLTDGELRTLIGVQLEQNWILFQARKHTGGILSFCTTLIKVTLQGALNARMDFLQDYWNFGV